MLPPYPGSILQYWELGYFSVGRLGMEKMIKYQVGVEFSESKSLEPLSSPHIWGEAGFLP